MESPPRGPFPGKLASGVRPGLQKTVLRKRAPTRRSLGKLTNSRLPFPSSISCASPHVLLLSLQFFTTCVHASDFEYTCPVKFHMRSIFQRFNPSEHHHWNFTSFVFAVLAPPIIHPLDNTIFLWSETGTVRTSGSANHGIFTFTLELVLSLWPLHSLTPKTDRKGDTIFQCNFFCRSVCIAHFTKLLITSLALPPVFFRPLLPCIAQAHRWSTDKDWNWNCDSPWCNPPAGVHRSHVSPLTVFFFLSR